MQCFYETIPDKRKSRKCGG